MHLVPVVSGWIRYEGQDVTTVKGCQLSVLRRKA